MSESIGVVRGAARAALLEVIRKLEADEIEPEAVFAWLPRFEPTEGALDWQEAEGFANRIGVDLAPLEVVHLLRPDMFSGFMGFEPYGNGSEDDRLNAIEQHRERVVEACAAVAASDLALPQRAVEDLSREEALAELRSSREVLSRIGESAEEGELDPERVVAQVRAIEGMHVEADDAARTLTESLCEAPARAVLKAELVGAGT